jgi:hypothetical protein
MGSAVAVGVRLFHLTFYKCGSQWVRDILADSRIVAHSEHTLATGGIDLQAERWPDLRPSQIASPLYSTGTGEWKLVARPADRAFAVIRDPRDIVVSLVYSVSLSHTPSAITLLLRDPLAAANPTHRLQIGMFLFAQWAEYLRSWRDAADHTNVLLARYESLLTDLPGELRRLFAFLEWDIPAGVVEAVAAENSFQQRSGRRPGEQNEFSHRRKGIAGDWKNHFDRGLGELFENSFPGLLTDLGYENGNEWWRSLPSAIPATIDKPDAQRARLLAVLAEHEKELAVVRLAADERLHDVKWLHAQLQEQTCAAEERLALIRELDQQLKRISIEQQRTQRAADERLADILRRETSRLELESTVAWRCGFRPVKAITSLFRK